MQGTCLQSISSPSSFRVAEFLWKPPRWYLRRCNCVAYINPYRHSYARTFVLNLILITYMMPLRVFLLVVLVKLSRSQTETVPECIPSRGVLDCLSTYVSLRLYSIWSLLCADLLQNGEKKAARVYQWSPFFTTWARGSQVGGRVYMFTQTATIQWLPLC
jgi:hypothetical protein